jgi:hypothetical protein
VGRLIFSALAFFLLAPVAAAQTADVLWQSLMEGNRTFVAGRVTFDNLGELRHDSAAHQNPPVQRGRVGLVTAYYNLSTGVVERIL